jgi:hypothetical protein
MYRQAEVVLPTLRRAYTKAEVRRYVLPRVQNWGSRQNGGLANLSLLRESYFGCLRCWNSGCAGLKH